MSEAVEILIDADDQATGKLAKVGDSVDQQVKRIKDVGGKAKASTEFIGTLASSLGGSELASYASQFAGLTDKVSQFSEVSKAGAGGALAFKAGLLGVAAVAGYKVGTAIGDWIFETDRWRKKLAEANEELQTAAANLNRVENIKLSFKVEKAGLEGEVAERKLLNDLTEEAFKIEKEIEETKARQLKDSEGMVGWARYLAGNAEKVAEMNAAELSASKLRLESINAEKEALIAKLSPQKAELDAMKEKAALQDRNKSYIEGLQQEVDLLKAKSDEERLAMEARIKAGGDSEAAKRIESLMREKEAIEALREADTQREQDAKKLADEQARDAERLADLKQKENDRIKEQMILLTQGKEAAKAFALEQQGLDQQTAKQIAAKEAALDRLGKKEVGSSGPLQAVQSRLLNRGPGDNTAKQQLDLTKQMKDVLTKIEQHTQATALKESVQLEILRA